MGRASGARAGQGGHLEYTQAPGSHPQACTAWGLLLPDSAPLPHFLGLCGQGLSCRGPGDQHMARCMHCPLFRGTQTPGGPWSGGGAGVLPGFSLSRSVPCQVWGAVVFPHPLLSLVSRPHAAVPWQQGLTLSPAKWRLSLGTRGLGPGRPGREQTTALRVGVWARALLRTGSGRSRGQHVSAFGRYCFVFNYTKFPDFILSYQRHRMLAHSSQRRTR